MSELFIEFICEEIPARMQKNAISHMAKFLSASLVNLGLLESSLANQTKTAIGPRHMAVGLSSVVTKQADRYIEKRGPKIDAPQQAIDGFCKSIGILSSKLVQKNTDKGVFYFAELLEKGRKIESIIPEIIFELVSEFPWPKSQRWGTSKLSWVRPLHQINVVLDGNLLKGNLDLGGGMRIDYTNVGYGHSFYHSHGFEISSFDSYVSKMRELDVLVDADERQNSILKSALELAKQKGLQLRSDKALLDEVCGLVECPNVLCGKIDDKFMVLPDEVLVTSMRVHQKYFALENKSGRIEPYFLLVANRKPNKQTDAVIIKGNERVLRARLSDALFFWKSDCTESLATYRQKLNSIMFYKGLGQLSNKVDRMEELAALIATYIPRCSATDASMAAGLSKSDLVTGMVGEFPELQGVMGSYYASAQSIATSQVLAIRDHYLPKGAEDRLPETLEGIAVSMADKIDTLVGFFGVNVRPTGSKDPFALRRAALGILRMIEEHAIQIPLDKIFIKAAALYGFKKFDDELASFITERLKVRMRDNGSPHDVVSAAIIDADIHNLHGQIEKVKAIESMLGTPAGVKLLESWRRAANIIFAETKNVKGKGNNSYSLLEFIDENGIDENLFEFSAEKNLFKAIEALPDEVGETQKQICNTMEQFSSLYEPITDFFETVKVNDEDEKIRTNRLNLLANVCNKIQLLADFEKIEK